MDDEDLVFKMIFYEFSWSTNNYLKSNIFFLVRVVFVFFTAKLISLILQRRDWMKMKKYTFFFLFSQKPLLEILAADLSWETYIGQEEWNRQKGLSNLFERKRFKFFCFILNYHKYWPGILKKRGKKEKKIFLKL